MCPNSNSTCTTLCTMGLSLNSGIWRNSATLRALLPSESSLRKRFSKRETWIFLLLLSFLILEVDVRLVRGWYFGLMWGWWYQLDKRLMTRVYVRLIKRLITRVERIRSKEMIIDQWSPLQEKIRPQPRWAVSSWRPSWNPSKNIKYLFISILASLRY